jgi:hypothetical protein
MIVKQNFNTTKDANQIFDKVIQKNKYIKFTYCLTNI